jgi:hypothetical protein
MTVTSNVENTPPAQSTVATVVLTAVLVLFVLAIVLIVTAAMTRRTAKEFAPSPIEARPQATALAIDTITIDARDPESWQWFSFATQSVVASPTAGWDLAFRRFHVITAAGARNLGPRDFDSVTSADGDDYIETEFGQDSTSVVFDDWYRYNFLSHLLEPHPAVYVLETQNGGHAKLTLLSYYCPKLEAGCVTFVYAYQPDGSGRFIQ